MFYYAPQCWTSDDSDGGERLRIQYGTSYAYPVSFMGSHVSIAPNHQIFRNTSLKLRGDVAYFGTFGYELDLGKLSAEELDEVREQIQFMKKYRKLIQQGTFYRLKDRSRAMPQLGWLSRMTAVRQSSAITRYSHTRARRTLG